MFSILATVQFSGYTNLITLCDCKQLTYLKPA